MYKDRVLIKQDRSSNHSIVTLVASQAVETVVIRVLFFGVGD